MKTTNVCESWNANWKGELGNSSKNLLGIIVALKVQENYQKDTFRNFERGERPPIQRRKFRDLNVKIQTLKQDYEDNFIDINCYWTNISLICRSL